MLSANEYLASINIDRYPSSVVELVDRSNPKFNHLKFIMKDMVYHNEVGIQRRFANPSYHPLKSKTMYASSIGYFYDEAKLKKNMPIIIVEGEKDWLTAWYLGRNCVGLQGVGNLNKLVNVLAFLKYTRILLCVDQDEAADKAVSKVEKRDLCRDIRGVLGEHKDLSDAYLAKSNLSNIYAYIIPENNLQEKRGPFIKYRRRMPKQPIEDIDKIPVESVLEALYPQYKVRGERIYENGKLLNGYRIWKKNNIVKDFANKDRPEGNARKIAYEYFRSKKTTYEYLTNFL